LKRTLLLFAIATLGAVTASCLPLLDGHPTDLSNQEIRLTLLHTSDIHSRLIPYEFAPLKTDTDLGLIPEAGPFGGATRLAALIKRERAKGDRVLHLDSGDAFQGAPIFNQNLGEVEFKFLSHLRLDAAVVGNHEFDAGALNFSNQARDNATFPLLAANYFWDDHRELGSNQTGRYTAPYTIKTIKGVRIGVIGMANISSLNSIVEGGNSLQATPLEQNEAARGYVELLKPVTDLIVVTSHLGLTEDQDLIQGYDAFYEFGRIKYFLERTNDPWKVEQIFGPVDAQGVPEEKSVVRVRIPGVSGIDVIQGGHLHVVLNPPQVLTDPAGRKVVLSHSGAFAKYLGRLDIVVKMPPLGGSPDMAEVLSHEYRVFPVDSLWCNDAMHDFYKSQFWVAGQFTKVPAVVTAIAECAALEDHDTTQLLVPYILGMDFSLNLSSIFAYAPRDIARRNNSSGGDAPLGNVAADSMRRRRRVEAEFALTNSLGIRDNLYAGPISQESMFNVFPFENTINIMYISGVEMQEMFDFVSERSASRGCQSQAQISGGHFTMDCAQVQLNDLRFYCDRTLPPATIASECTKLDPDRDPIRAKWECLDDGTGDPVRGRCWAHPAIDVQINGQPLDANGTYKIAVNDYIAKGGSGFSVLKRNTTRIETNISLRDSLIGYMQGFCTCDDLLAEPQKLDLQGNLLGKNGQLCGNLIGGKWTIDPQEISYCAVAKAFKEKLDEPVAPASLCNCQRVFAGDAAGCAVPEITEDLKQGCLSKLPPGPTLGRCTCRDALSRNEIACGHITRQLRSFCENPTAVAVAIAVEDGRIGRRVK
jgi:5'-nucleotidase / UDP-sugar diphosphatase